jgi:hypothetical protein
LHLRRRIERITQTRKVSEREAVLSLLNALVSGSESARTLLGLALRAKFCGARGHAGRAAVEVARGPLMFSTVVRLLLKAVSSP